MASFKKLGKIIEQQNKIKQFSEFDIYFFFIGLEGRVFTKRPGDLGAIHNTKTLKMVLDTSLLNTQKYKVHIKGKVE